MLKRKFWNVAFVLVVCLSSGCCRFYSWWCDRPYNGGCYGHCYGPPQCGCGPAYYAPPNGCCAPPPNYGGAPSNYAPAAGPSAAPASQHGGQPGCQ